MNSAGCPSDELLSRYLAGPLPGAEEEGVADHVQTCSGCQERLDRLASADSLPLRAAVAAVPTPVEESLFLSRLRLFGAVEGAATARRRSRGEPASLENQVGDYEILEEIGRGGMGVVYKARHRTLGRLAAVKMILSGMYPEEKDRERFRAEAVTVAQLQHPNIVQLYEVGESAGQPYLVLEYVAGGNLHEKLDGQAQPPRAAAELVETLARTIHAAHLARIVHRDLKPANVLLASDGTPKLTDFGLAQQMDGSIPKLTQTLAGTPTYMAPEQVPEGPLPGPTPRVGPAVDVYALGVILYEMLTGRPPFLGPDWMTVLLQVARREPIALRELQPSTPRDLETICLRCLRKEPPHRYATALELADDLKRFLEGWPIKARPVGPVERAVKFVRRHPVLLAAVAATLLATVVAIVEMAVALQAVRQQQKVERLAQAALQDSNNELLRLRAAAERNLYFSRISQANLQWRDNDAAGARLTLERCPPKLRRWEWQYLRQLCDDGLLILRVPKGRAVRAVDVCPRWIAAVSGPPEGAGGETPGVLQVWDGLDGKELARTVLPDGGVPSQVFFVRNGQRLITVSATQAAAVVCAWDVERLLRKNARTVPPVRAKQAGPPPPTRVLVRTLRPFAVSPDGVWLAAPNPKDRTILQTVSLVTGKPGDRFLGAARRIAGVVFHPSGSRLLASAYDGKWRLWDLQTTKVVGEWLAGPAQQIAYSPNGLRVAACEAPASIRVRDGRTGRLLTMQPTSHSGMPTFSPDGRFLLLHTRIGAPCWDLNIRQRTNLTGRSGEVEDRVRALAMGPDGRTAATAETDGAVRLWDLPSGRGWGKDQAVYRGHDGTVEALAFSGDGRRLVSGGTDGTVRVWDLTRSQRGLFLADVEPGRSRRSVLFFHAAGRQLLSVHDRQLLCRDSRTGRLLAQRVLDWVGGPGELRHDIAATPDGARLLTVDADRTGARLWRLGPAPEGGVSLKEERRFRGARLPIAVVAVSPDGQRVATGGGAEAAEGEMCLWNGETGALVERRTGATWRVRALAWSADGVTLATAGFGGVRLIGGAGEQTLVEGAPGLRVSSLAFHPQGKQLAVVAPADGRVTVWRLPAGARAWQARLADPPTQVGFSPDGSRLAVIGATGELSLWDSTSGVEALKLPGGNDSRPSSEAGSTAGLAFSADGGRVAGGGRAGTMIWTVSDEEDRTWASRRRGAEGRARAWHAEQMRESWLYEFAERFHRVQHRLLPRE